MRGAKTGDPMFRAQGESVALSLFCIMRAAYIKRIWIKSFSTARVISSFFLIPFPRLKLNSSCAHSPLNFPRWHTLKITVSTPFTRLHWSLISWLIHAGAVCISASGCGQERNTNTDVAIILHDWGEISSSVVLRLLTVSLQESFNIYCRTDL